MKLKHRLVKDQKNVIRFLMILFFILFTLVFTNISAIRYFSQNQLYSLGNGLWWFNTLIFPERSGLIDENIELKEMLLMATSSQILQEELRIENEELRNLLDFFNKRSDLRERLVMANIISGSSDNNRQLLIIDQGSRNGLKDGLAVLGQDGVLIGLVHETFQFQSTIRLLQDRNSSIPAKILEKDSSSGLIIGSEGFVLKLDFIPNTTNIEVGDIVVTDSTDLNIPNNLPIGFVQEVFSNPTNPFKQAIVIPYTNSRRLRTVGIIR